MWTLVMLLSCADPPPAPARTSPADQVALVRTGIQAAHRAWSAGDYPTARKAVMDAYGDAFTPLEPALRAADPTRTLKLEYGFGVLAQHLGRKGSPVKTAAEVRDFIAEVESAASVVVTLPVAPAQGSSTTDVEVLAPKPLSEVKPVGVSKESD